MPRSIKIIMYSLAAVTAILIVSTWLSVSCSDQQDEDKPEVNPLSIVDRSKKWTIQFGTGGYEAGRRLIINKSDEIYLSGTTQGNLDGQHPGPRGYDFFLAKYNTKGEQLFLKQYGTSAVDGAWRIGMDDGGNIYISGGTDGSIDNISVAGGSKNRDIFIMKVNSKGELFWIKQINTEGSQEIRDIVVYDNNSLYLFGSTDADFNGEKHIGKNDLLVLKMDMDGNLVWSKIFANGVFNKPMRINMINNDQVLLAWYSVGDMPETPEQVESRIYDDIYLMALDGEGNRLWQKKFGTDFDEFVGDVKIDHDSIYISAMTMGIFAQPHSKSSNDSDILLLKLDIKGNLVWYKQYGNAGPNSGDAIYIDEDNIYIAGRTSGFLANNLSNIPTDGLLVIKLTKVGDIIWSQKKLPYAASPLTPNFVYLSAGINPRDITIDSEGFIYVTGYTSGFLDHNQSTISDDAFILKYSPDGEQQ